MLRSQAMVLAIAAGATTLLMAGCDRQSANPPASVDIRSEMGGARGAKLAARPADESGEKSAAPGSPETSWTNLQTRVPLTSPRTRAPRWLPRSATTPRSAPRFRRPLRRISSLKSADIKVDSKDGMVTLSGNVDTASLRMHAKEVAARQQGVVGVIDNIAVASQG